jgi:uncharacterized membrane protein YoaK (UPF0700 family)
MTAESRSLGRDPRVRVVVLALAAIAGWLDGLTFAALGTVFVSAVTGDLVQLGITAADGEWGGFLVLAAALAAFGVGTAVAVLMTRVAGGRAWPGPVRRPLLVHAGLLVVFALLWTSIGDPRPATAEAVVLASVAALSAGIQGAVFLGLGVRGANVSAVTGVLMLLAAGVTERGSGLPGPRSELPLWELGLILAVYGVSGLIVALTLADQVGLLVWVPVAIAFAVVSVVPLRDPKPSTP